MCVEVNIPLLLMEGKKDEEEDPGRDTLRV